MDRKHLTIAAISTPSGRGGVGIVRISGFKALDVVSSLTGLSSFQPRYAQFSSWRSADGEVIDTGITLYFPAPHSYTGDHVVELQGHGSPVVLRMLLKRCLELGCEPAQPGEFTQRALLNHKMDLSQAEAVIACIDAQTERAALQAQKQLDGEFGRKISALMDGLTGIVAHVEACLDFPEDEIPDLFLDQLKQRLTDSILNPINQMLSTAMFGERLFDGANVAIIGSPNVGKSSLLNALSGRDRAIVSDIEGTTRDTLEIDFEIHGIPVRLVDTAGVRESDDFIEQEGVRRALHSAQQADLVIFVADAVRSETWTIASSFDVAVLNKCDQIEGLSDDMKSFIPVSAKQGDGIDQLADRLAQLLGEVSDGESLFITSQRHQSALEKSVSSIEQAMHLLDDESTMDLAALQLRYAWSSMGEILGIGDVEHILDKVFSEFCIGK